ncbi:MAG: DUF4394 domain-containing protein [Acidobacteriota bacterium]|nr:DUF4394 domain-containing protein [Acidobacteriota bacterium]
MTANSKPIAKYCILVLFTFAFADLARADFLGVEADTGKLYSISETTGALSFIGNTGIGPNGATVWAEIQFAPNGILYGFTAGEDRYLYTINPTTAQPTLVGPLRLSSVFEGGLAFSPAGVAYGASAGNSQLFTINLATGAATIVGTMSGGPHDINGLAYRSDGKLVGLDGATNSLVVIDPVTAVITPLAVLAPIVGVVGGMTVSNGVGYFNTGGPVGTPPASNSLYSFDLFTGAATLVGSFGPTINGFGISGLAALPPVPEPSTSLILGLGIAILIFAGVKQRKRLKRTELGSVN